MATIVHGNPFTHWEEKRESVPGKGQTCAWCGDTRRVFFRYNDSREVFCNRGCWLTYSS